MKKIQAIINVLGVAAFMYFIKAMLITPTLILTPIFLAICNSIILLIISLTIGYLISKVFKLKFHLITVSSIVTIFLTLALYIFTYKPTYDIVIPESFYGTVYLIESDSNDFNISNFGIGYVESQGIENGFKTKIFLGGKDISEKVSSYSSGGFFSEEIAFDYVSFEIPNGLDNNEVSVEYSFSDLFNKGAIDTSRVKR